ncbi:Acetylornithine aminotransferase, mitochondrial [Clarias magur]|uniref:Acetylornithine aminotransferase, mitochondrial n=1 Tax=Clarias magur TaxID=1594786 RepID=A0A8J4X1W0_CLAMG|nr:Acetylornithine aminotransferase, mitochondrial [Clarias magur]
MLRGVGYKSTHREARHRLPFDYLLPHTTFLLRTEQNLRVCLLLKGDVESLR